ncbi:nuclear transport factor 2 family protein [Candidatus Acetothermia bacterium]|nr:nuclear transport factor 2 family protein [Candidatus Acetothermia bacterium]MBI3642628.1 nuclear transport factor 2 family protein [Candidatus Acetothermia bacterium]
MPSAHASVAESEIRQWLDQWQKAFHEKNLDAIMSLYASGNELVVFDIVPPLQYIGADAYRKDYKEFLAQYDGPVDVEFRDTHIVAGDDIAIVYSLEKLSGTIRGQKSEIWTRVTSGFRKIDGKWLDVHDHVSVPVDLETGKAELELKP